MGALVGAPATALFRADGLVPYAQISTAPLPLFRPTRSDLLVTPFRHRSTLHRCKITSVQAMGSDSAQEHVCCVLVRLSAGFSRSSRVVRAAATEEKPIEVSAIVEDVKAKVSRAGRDSRWSLGHRGCISCMWCTRIAHSTRSDLTIVLAKWNEEVWHS